MAHTKHTMSADVDSRRRRSTESSEPLWDHELKGRRYSSQCDRLCVAGAYHEIPDTPSPCTSQYLGHYTPKCVSAHRHSLHSRCMDDVWQETSIRTTIRAENEVEAHKLANNYRFGFRKWKSHVTERPIEDRSDVVKELYSELNYIKHHSGSLVTIGNVVYVLLFGWWISLLYFLVSLLMFCSIAGIPYGKLCLQLSGYFLWPFGKALKKSNSSVRKCCMKFPHCEAIPEEVDEVKESLEEKESTPLLRSAPAVTTEMPVIAPPTKQRRYWCRLSTYVWLVLGYPLLAVVHCLAIFISWMIVFTIPVAKMNARTLSTILLMPPEEVKIHTVKKPHGCETKVLLCCYHAFNWYYYKYTVEGINVFAVNLLPLVIITLVNGYVDREHYYVSSEAKFATSVTSIIPLSYFIGMGIASISAQSNLAVGAVVNATFGSITEMAFYITALLQGHRAGSRCYAEVVKSALTGTLLGCILFVPVFLPPRCFQKLMETLYVKAATTLLITPQNPSYATIDTMTWPLVYTISVLLPAAYLIGLIFTLKTHSHIYDIHISDGHILSDHGAVVHWSRLRALVVLILATLMMAACADLCTENIRPIISNSSVSQYFIGVTVLAMVPELPEIVNGVQFALQNNISLSLEVGSCIAVQVCMLQIPLLILFNAFYDVGFVLLFSDLHLWASIFSVILVNYIFMDGKSDYFQGTALVVVYLILLALYFFAPAPLGC
ncbi:cation/H+ exchanger protein 1 [Triplophysa rosa]|uniref:Cation/H+ exchanger protein 1 n=1 Tax=Triplophysa rosa TaxID=992332 RepID=A0A9W7T6G8_TRIRA|nr:cation/H+ exchanger protein 1 [Triplophysa rosa]